MLHTQQSTIREASLILNSRKPLMWAHLSFISLLLKGIQQDGGTHEPVTFTGEGMSVT